MLGGLVREWRGYRSGGFSRSVMSAVRRELQYRTRSKGGAHSVAQ